MYVAAASRCTVTLNMVARMRPHLVFTDASLRKGRAGIGIYYQTAKCLENYALAHKRPMHSPDINHAELAAIFVAVLRSHRRTDLEIYTDSQVSINLLERGTTKAKFKMLTDCTRWLLWRREGAIKLKKVKGHSGVLGNEVADRLAGEAFFGRPEIILPDDFPDWGSSVEEYIISCARANKWEVEQQTIINMHHARARIPMKDALN